MDGGGSVDLSIITVSLRISRLREGLTWEFALDVDLPFTKLPDRIPLLSSPSSCWLRLDSVLFKVVILVVKYSFSWLRNLDRLFRPSSSIEILSFSFCTKMIFSTNSALEWSTAISFVLASSNCDCRRVFLSFST